MLRPQDKIEIENLALFFMAKINSLKDFAQAEFTAKILLANKIYSWISGLFWQGSAADLVLKLFDKYLDDFEHELQFLYFLDLPAMKKKCLDAEHELIKLRRNMINVEGYMRHMLIINKLSNNILGKTTDDCLDPQKKYLEALDDLKEEIILAVKSGLHEDCQYIFTLRKCFEIYGINYFIRQCRLLEQAFWFRNYDELSNMLRSFVLIIDLDSITRVVDDTGIVDQMRLDDFKAAILNGLVKYARILLACSQAVVDIEDQMLSIYNDIESIQQCEFDFIRNKVLSQQVLDLIATNLGVNWRENGRILPQNLLIKKINFISLLQKSFHGKELSRILSLKLHAEMLYADTLNVDQLVKYYRYISDKVTLNKPLLYDCKNISDNAKIRQHDQNLINQVESLILKFRPNYKTLKQNLYHDFEFRQSIFPKP